ncbi:MAG: Rrf2 family transcriptional regulator [Sedimentisphaerales bacterium]|nr:Rrf2 family transcriptional regulator [Sedimentisphaerales bacterium]
MKLSTRVRYGVRAMIELALHEGGKPVPLRKLAENQAISAKYLEQIATSLKIGGLIDSVRGAEGGYRLARAAENINLWDIYAVLDIAGDTGEEAAKAGVPSEETNREGICAIQVVWKDLTKQVKEFMVRVTLADLAAKQQQYSRKGGKK